MSPLEIAANAVTTLSIVLAGRNNLHTWWTGIVGCVLFSVLFYQSNLYADVALQLFFVVTSGMGWWRWAHGGQGQPSRVAHANFPQLIWTLPVGIVGTLGYGVLLHHYTQAYAPFVDSMVLVFSVMAQWLLMQRRIETWAFWLLVNTIAAPLYASRGLYLTAFLYLFYWINAIVSWLWWHRLVQRSAGTVAAA